MNCRKTICNYPAFMVKLFILTLSISSSGVKAESGYDNELPNGFKDNPSNLWYWLSVDAAKQTVKLTNELQCLALNIYFEARSESTEGQQAVGHVVMNRVAHRGFPDSICGVVKQGGETRRNRCQFSWWCDGRSDEPVNKSAWLKSLYMAYDIYQGRIVDPTHGALWYHADYVSPAWSKALTMVTKIGQHLFYQSREQTSYAMNLSQLLPSRSGIKNKL